MRKTALTFLLVIVQVLCFGQDKCKSLKQQADSFYHAGLPLQSINTYTEMISIGCNNLQQLYNNRGSLYNDIEQYDSALSDLLKAYAIDSTEPSGLTNLAICYSYLKDYNKALQYINKAISYDTSASLYYKLRADIETNYKNYPGAEGDYKKSIMLNKHNIDAHEGLIVLYKYIARRQEDETTLNNVLEAYADAIKSNPDHPYIRVERGYFYYIHGQGAKAVEDYTFYLNTDPKSYRTFVNRALAYETLEQYDSALADYNSSIAVNENYLAYYNRGRLYRRYFSNNKQAIKDNLKCIELNPGYAIAYLNLGNCYFDEKQYSKAKDAYKKGLANNPDGDTKTKLDIALSRLE